MNRTIIIALVCLVLIGIGGYLVFAHNAPTSVVPPVATSTVPTVVITSTATTVTHPTPKPPITQPPKPVTGAAMITQSDNGKTVTLTKGERFGVAMGDTLDWSLSFDPEGIVTRVTNIATTRGEQGVYTATAIGKTVLHATGAPICNPDQACPQFRQAVIVTLAVK